jgi:hypothetical protein
VAAETVSVVEPEMPVPPSVAVMVVVPTPTVVASPSEPAALEIVATVVTEELHETEVVRSAVLPSL